MSEIINLSSKRPPVVYTVTIVHHYDDTLEYRIDDVADDERSREAVMSSFRRISGADEEIEKLRNDLRNATFSDTAYTKEIERQDVLLREENTRLRELLQECADDLETAVNGQYGEMARKVMPDRYERDMQPVIKARAAIREGGRDE